MSSSKSLVIGCVVGLLVGASASRADDIVPPNLLTELRRIATALERANDLSRDQVRVLGHVADEVERCR